MIYLSQRNPLWAAVKLGQSNCTVGRFGCTTTCISMLSDYFKSFIDPGTLASKTLSYTKDGLIIWQSVDNIPLMKMDTLPDGKVKRLYGQNDAEIMASLKDKKKAVILQVNNGQHWVVALRRSLLNKKDYIVLDPWDGKQVSALKKYHNITGSAHFTAK